MGFIEIFFIGVGLAMDAFAVSVCKGLSVKDIDLKKSCTIALYFGSFQAIMPYMGYIFGSTFQGLITKYDHWIAFMLLTVIGIKMIRDAIINQNYDEKNDDISIKTMLILAIATSIDALAVGITFSFFKINIIMAISIIGIVTFILSYIGVKVGTRFGDKFERKSEIFGGIILILIGIKIVIEHLEII